MKKNFNLTGCSKRSRYKAPETGNPPRRGGTERCLLREEIPRNEGNPAVGGIDGPFSATC